ncbi:VOC family protein [Subtercola lobariae]|uniref:Glyoxalase n=1 Tax=Subtercola lobariae TaxID=1588641 RepID=A0A917BC71_9MICO|nr:VOC family protein [Subtercola lobariae]GGF34533.1 glyoxalase [Subtercola lobariae]
MGVTGMGGLFFRSRQPDARAQWYRDHLGIDAGDDRAWNQEAGATVFAPFASDSDYFAADQPFMLNLRVSDLTELVAELKAAGIEVEQRPEWEGSEYGRFARIYDPEGLPIELWEAPA